MERSVVKKNVQSTLGVEPKASRLTFGRSDQLSYADLLSYISCLATDVEDAESSGITCTWSWRAEARLRGIG